MTCNDEIIIILKNYYFYILNLKSVESLIGEAYND